MNSISLKIHSVIDLITNSSTEIYTNSGSIESIKEFINELLAEAGSLKTADDLYTFKIKASPGNLDSALDSFYDEDPDKLLALLKSNQELVDAITKEGYIGYDLGQEVLKIIPEEEIMEYHYNDDDYGSETVCMITSKKSGDRSNFTDKILGLLNQTAY